MACKSVVNGHNQDFPGKEMDLGFGFCFCFSAQETSSKLNSTPIIFFCYVQGTGTLATLKKIIKINSITSKNYLNLIVISPLWAIGR